MNIVLHGQELLAESKKLGFVSYLTTVKSISEFKMISLAWDERYRTDQDNVPRFQSKYNLLKLAVDRLINQLSADMLLSNKVKVYRRINNFIKLNRSGLPGHLSNYSDLIKEIDGRLVTFMSETYYDEKAEISVDEITGVAELVHGVIIDARDFREKKVANLCLLLKDLKLQSLVDLTESKEE